MSLVNELGLSLESILNFAKWCILLKVQKVYFIKKGIDYT